MVSTKPLFGTSSTAVSGDSEDVATTTTTSPVLKAVRSKNQQRPLPPPPQKRRSKQFAPTSLVVNHHMRVVEEQQEDGVGGEVANASAEGTEEYEEEATAQTHYQDDDDRMIDLEQGNILKELKEHRNSYQQNGGRISGNSSVASLSDQIEQSTRFWSFCFRSTTDRNGKVIYQYKWVFSAVIVLLGAAAMTIVILLGLDGVMKNSEQQFIHEATQLTNVLQLSWEGYETLALWVHESCHYNIYESDVQLHHNKSTINSLTEQNLLDDGISLREGFCSRNKFR